MEMDGTSMASPAVCATLAAVLSKDADFAGLPRDRSRSQAARALLEDNCMSLGLSRSFQGLGMPVLGAFNAEVPDNDPPRKPRKRKARKRGG
jgi:hypothetical protein